MDSETEKVECTVREAGKKGGARVKEKYGTEYFQMIGRKGGQRTKDKYGTGFYSDIGMKGGKKSKPRKNAEDVL